MAKFLRFCKNMPEGTDLRPAMEGYGRYLTSSEPPLQEWRFDQARETLRCFQKGIENWHIGAEDEEGQVEVGFRVRTRGSEMPVFRADIEDSRSLERSYEPVEAWLEKSEQRMKVRRLALRTVGHLPGLAGAIFEAVGGES